MKKTLLISYLVAISFFAWGYAMVRFGVFPWQYLQPIEQEIAKFIKGAPGEETKVSEKIVNDFNIRPARLLYDYQEDPTREYRRVVEMENLRSRRVQPQVFSTGEEMTGYRFMYGSFGYNDALHAGILLDSNHQVIHRWIVDQDKLKDVIERKNQEDGGDRKLLSPNLRLPQGLEVLRDGSMIVNEGYQGNGMQNVDFCSEFNWSALGAYHHIVALNEDDQTLWAFGPGDIEQLDLASGEVLRTINHREIHKANPEISIFTPRRSIRKGQWLNDPFHENDIEPLTERLASAFPMFDPGDLLVTHRSTNMVFVFDPEDLKVKWWRNGVTRRPHDADWQPDGTITIYDNNMREPVRGNDGDLIAWEPLRYSRIVRVDPDTFE